MVNLFPHLVDEFGFSGRCPDAVVSCSCKRAVCSVVADDVMSLRLAMCVWRLADWFTGCSRVRWLLLLQLKAVGVVNARGHQIEVSRISLQLKTAANLIDIFLCKFLKAKFTILAWLLSASTGSLWKVRLWKLGVD